MTSPHSFMYLRLLSLKAELNHDYSLEQMAAILDALEKYQHYKG